MITGSEYDVIGQIPFTKFKGLNGSKLYFVNTMNEWKAFFAEMMTKKLVACDTETSGFRYYKDDHIVGMSFGWGDVHFYIPVRHEDSLTGGAQPPQLRMEDIKDDLIKFFSRTNVITIWQNAKFDFLFYSREGIIIKTPFHDTRIMWHLYDENAPGALKTIASGWRDRQGRWHKGLVGKEANAKEKELDAWRAAEARARQSQYRHLVMARADELRTEIEHQDKNRNELKAWIKENEFQDHPYRKASKKDVHYGFVPADLMTEYAATDTYLTYLLYEFITKNFPFNQKLKDLYIVELKLSKVLTATQRAGARINRNYLHTLDDRYTVEITQQRKDLVEKLGDINFSSNAQLAVALTDLGVPLTDTTPSGALKVDKSILNKFRSQYAVIDDLISLKEMEKLKSTYVLSILDKLTDDDVLHCSYNQNVTTGRMSSSDPNLMNIPGRDTAIRKAFIPWSPEHVAVFMDYSQIEVRLTAHFSEDPVLLDAYAKNQDIHTRTLCEMFDFDYEETNAIIKADDPSHEMFKELKQKRNIAKIINFSIIYGSGAPGLSEQITRPEQYKDLSEQQWIDVCQSYIDMYLRRYRGVKKYVNKISREIRQHGVVYNHFGRPRRLPDALMKGNSNYKWVSRAQRQAVNFMVQSAAADIFKIATVRVYDILEGSQSRLFNFVHDDLQSYIHKEELHFLNTMKAAMEDFDFLVPLEVGVSWSPISWADKRELG